MIEDLNCIDASCFSFSLFCLSSFHFFPWLTVTCIERVVVPFHYLERVAERACCSRHQHHQLAPGCSSVRSILALQMAADRRERKFEECNVDSVIVQIAINLTSSKRFTFAIMINNQCMNARFKNKYDIWRKKDEGKDGRRTKKKMRMPILAA